MEQDQAGRAPIGRMDENVERGGPGQRDIDAPDRSEEGGDPNSLDRILSGVANEYRRAILRSLHAASDQTLDVDELVDRVADAVEDERTTGISGDRRRRVSIALHHMHLPKLVAGGMVDYEAESGRVEFVGGDLEGALLTLVGSHEAAE